MVTTAYLQKVQTIKCRPNLYDDPKRRIRGAEQARSQLVGEGILLPYGVRISNTTHSLFIVFILRLSCKIHQSVKIDVFSYYQLKGSVRTNNSLV